MNPVLVQQIAGLVFIALLTWLFLTAVFRMYHFKRGAWVAAPASWLLAYGVTAAIILLSR